MNDTFFLIVYIIFASIVFVFFFFAVKGLFYTENTLTILGLKDETILKKLKNTKNNKASRKVNLIIDTSISALVIGLSLFLVTINSIPNPTKYFNTIPVAITSGSMSKKDSSNKYLKENNLDNQFPTGSTILLHRMPEKDELNQYDVVAYKNKKGVTVVHRIVSFGTYDSTGHFIRVNNIKNADKFVFRGDYNTADDSDYVDYSSMIGIYRGEYCPYLGYFIQFAQSYFGLACFVAIVAIIISYDSFEGKNRRIEIERYITVTGDYSIIKEKHYERYNEENKENKQELRELINRNKIARRTYNLEEVKTPFKTKVKNCFIVIKDKTKNAFIIVKDTTKKVINSIKAKTKNIIDKIKKKKDK